MQSLADLDQLSARLGGDLSPESPDGIRGQAALDDASALVRAVTGYTWIDSSDSAGGLLEVPELIQTIVLAAALRAYRNPTGAAQASVGDVSLSYGGQNGGAVFLTRDEKVAALVAVGRSTMATVPLQSDLLPSSAADELLLAPTEGGGDPIPLGPIPWED